MNISQNDIKSIGVFCGSAIGTSACYREAAKDLGQLMVSGNLRLVYGGGNVGLMGVIADSILGQGGKVTGVITKHLAGVELAHKGVANMIVTDSMSERKNRILDLSDAFIALAGGLGTMDELFEALTMSQLHLIKKPIGLLNTAGFFDPVLAMLTHFVREGFMRHEHLSLIVVDENPAALLEKLGMHKPPETLKWLENFNKEKI